MHGLKRYAGALRPTVRSIQAASSSVSFVPPVHCTAAGLPTVGAADARDELTAHATSDSLMGVMRSALRQLWQHGAGSALTDELCSIVDDQLASGASVRGTDAFGNTPLHLAVHWPMQGARRMVTAMVTSGADIEAKNVLGQTPLLVSSAATVETLLHHRADVHAQDMRKRTRLHVSAWTDPAEILHSLLDAGGHAFMVDKLGRSPLHYACLSLPMRYNRHAHRALAVGSARAAYHHDDARVPDLGYRVIFALLKGGANAHAADIHGLTPLHIVAHSGHEKIMKLLLHRGAAGSVAARDKLGNTPLHYAARREWSAHVRHVDDMVMSDLDESAGETHVSHDQVPADESYGTRPVSAIWNADANVPRPDDSGVYNLLLDHDADPEARNSVGVRPSDIFRHAQCDVLRAWDAAEDERHGLLDIDSMAVVPEPFLPGLTPPPRRELEFLN